LAEVAARAQVSCPAGRRSADRAGAPAAFPAMPPSHVPTCIGLGLLLLAGLGLPGCTNTPPSAGNRGGPTTVTTVAARESDEVLERRAQSHAHYANGVLLEMQGRARRAVASFQDAARLDPANEELAWDVAQRCVALRQPDSAIEVLRATAQQPGASGLAWARLAALQLQSGRPEAALESGTKAIERDPGVLQGHQAVFLSYLQTMQLQEAHQTLLEAAPHGGDDPEYFIQLAELHALLLAHGAFQRDEIQAEMRTLLNRASALPIDDDLLRLRLADAYMAAGDDERATVVYEELLETLPDVGGVRDDVRTKLTSLYLRGKDTEAAARELRKLVDSDPTNMRALYLLGSMAFDAGDFETARGLFLRVLILRPQFEQAYYDLAGVLLSLNRPSEAEEVIETARGKFPQSFAMDFIDALTHVRRGEFDRAITLLTRAEITAQALDPARLTPAFHFQFGAAAERAGDQLLAERHLERCLELDPAFAPAQNYLGYMWAERGENLSRAETLIRAAVEAEPENAAYLDSLAWVLFKQDRPTEALRVMQRAVEHLEEPDATLYEHLGDIHEALGRNDDAVAAWTRSMEIQKTDRVAERLLEHGVVIDSMPEGIEAP